MTGRDLSSRWLTSFGNQSESDSRVQRAFNVRETETNIGWKGYRRRHRYITDDRGEIGVRLAGEERLAGIRRTAFSNRHGLRERIG